MNDPQRVSPLGHRQPIGEIENKIALAERPFLGKLILRTNQANVLKKNGMALPAANKSIQHDRAVFVSLGPDEWMIVTLPDEVQSTGERVSGILEARRHQLVDVTDYYTIIRISGDQAVPTLLKLSTLDLHPRQFKNSDVASSMFGKANGWLMKIGDQQNPEFDLCVRWSMADYLWCLLAEAGREFGLPTQTPLGQEKGLRYKNA